MHHLSKWILFAFLCFAFLISQRAIAVQPLGEIDGAQAVDYLKDNAAALHETYKSQEHSFKSPFPFHGYFKIDNWGYGGSTVVTEDFVRLTPDRQNKKGWLWSKSKTSMNDWEAVFEFRVSGQGVSSFGDGMAFWFTTTPKESGPVYGSRDQWFGLGIFIDTFDNNGNGDGPRLFAVWNDGRTKYNHDADGLGQEVGSCQLTASRFRNARGYTTVVVTVLDGKLRIKFAYPDTDHYIECFRDREVSTGSGQKFTFGFSAATGDIADNHDVRSFQVYDLKAMAAAEGKETHDHDEHEFELKAQRLIERRERRLRARQHRKSSGGDDDDDDGGLLGVLLKIINWFLLVGGIVVLIVVIVVCIQVWLKRRKSGSRKSRPGLPGAGV